MRVLFLGLVWAFLGLGSELAFASSEASCEQRLGAGFSALVERAFSQNVLKIGDLESLAHSDQPFNPLASVTRGSKNSSFAHVFAAHAGMDQQTWLSERAKVQDYLRSLSADVQTSQAAAEETRAILAPAPFTDYPSPHVIEIVEHKRRTFVALEAGGYLELRELGKPGYLWRSKTPWDKSFDTSVFTNAMWFAKTQGTCRLVYYRKQKMGRLESLKHLGKKRIEEILVDVETLSESVHALYAKRSQSFRGISLFAPYKEPESSAHASSSGMFKDMVFVDQWIVPLIDGKQLSFTANCPDGVEAYAEAYKTSTDRVLVAVSCRGAGIRIFAPLESKDPVFSYVFTPAELADPNLYARRFRFFERQGEIFLAVEYNTRPILFFDLRGGGPIASLDLRPFRIRNWTIGHGGNNQVFLTTEYPHVRVFKLFTETEAANP